MSSQTFGATVEPAGNATGVVVPAGVVEELGAGRRPPVSITINGHTWRSRIASKGGRFLIGISAANRAAARIGEGDEVTVTVAVDTKPRVVEEPHDVKRALDADPAIRAAFEALPFGLRRKHVNDIQQAKAETTRQRRIERLLDTLR